MIDFVQPWMLLGIVAAAVPLWLHLFGRRRAAVQYFSALDFILATNPKKARALQLREWTLLALRCLVVCALALALARPSLPLPGRAAEVAIGAGPQAVVLVIDDSESMAAASHGGSGFERARRRALHLLGDLPQGALAAVVTSGYPARSLLRQLTADRQALLRSLAQAQVRPRRDDAVRALALAQQLLESATEVPSRRLIVLTDLQASGWQAIAAPTLRDRGPALQVFVERIAPDSLENTAIIDAAVDRGADKSGAQVRVEVSIVHHGQKPWRDYVSVRAAEREVKSLVQLQPGEVARRSFMVPASAQWAEIVLPNDALDTDNRRLVRLDAATALRVAIINGAPRPVPREDEAFFIAQALEMGSGGPGELTVDRIPADKLNAAALADHDVAIAANLAGLSADSELVLRQFVVAGGGLWVTLGDNLPEPVGDYLATLLPTRLAGLRTAALSGAAGHRSGGVALAAPRPAAAVHALVGQRSVAAQLTRDLADLAEVLPQVRVIRYALSLPAADLGEKVVLRYGDGAPALLAHHVGAGRVALWTTSIDRDWTDLPLQPAFLPLTQAVVRALAGTRALERKAAVEVGETATLGRDERADQLQVRLEGDSDGDNRTRRVLHAALQHAGQWAIADLDTPGRYMATELRGGVALTSRPLLVVAPHSESDLQPAASGALAAKTFDGTSAATAATLVPKSPVWTAVLVALLGLLVMETALVARGGWSGRAPRWLARWL